MSKTGANVRSAEKGGTRMIALVVVVFLAAAGVIGYVVYQQYARKSAATGLVRKVYQKGLAAKDKGHYATAEAAFSLIVERYPQSPVVSDAKEQLAIIRAINDSLGNEPTQ